VAAPVPTQAAPTPTPKPEYTPQQIAENLIFFSHSEAQSRGYERNTDPFGMFTEGAHDVARGAEPIPDQLILERSGQEVLDAYKAGIQWAQDSVTKAKAAPISKDEDLSPSFQSIRGEQPAAPAPRRVAPSAPTEAPKPSFLETLSPEEKQGWRQSKEAYEAAGVTSGKQAGYEVPDYIHSLYQEGINSVTQGKTIPSRQQLEEAVGPYNADYFEMGVTKERNKRIKATVMRKPGKTAAEKVLNMAQAEVDAMPKEDMVGQVTPYTPEYETIRAKPGINATRMAKMLGPQLYGDPTNMGQVCIKEVLQNSFDATRTAINDGQITQGDISITISKDGRTLTVKDNGIGMTPQLLGGKFLEIAGTAKEGDKNAGGFGIAKMLFLYANKNIRVSTARDGRIAEMDVTGEQLFAALDDPNEAPNIEIREFDPVDQLAFPDGHGTIIQLTIPEESGDY
jgi:hypothetical protein